jgi:hypothetical protein
MLDIDKRFMRSTIHATSSETYKYDDGRGEWVGGIKDVLCAVQFCEYRMKRVREYIKINYNWALLTKRG